MGMTPRIATIALGLCLGGLCLDATAQTPQTPASPAAAQGEAAKTRSAPLKVGEVAPDFTLADEEGRQVMLSAARGRRPVVLVFYRGYW